jgi:hypothetical protein
LEAAGPGEMDSRKREVFETIYAADPTMQLKA